MGKKGGGGGTTKTVSEPWSGQKPYLSTAMQAAGAMFDPWIQKDKDGTITGISPVNNALAPAYYSGNTVAGQSAWTKQALQMQADAAKGMASSVPAHTARMPAKGPYSGMINFLSLIVLLLQKNRLIDKKNPDRFELF